MSLNTLIILAATLALTLPIIAFAIIGAAAVWLFCWVFAGVDILQWGNIRNNYNWLRRLPGRGFVRATREWEVFSVSYIRPAVYDFAFSIKEGKINTWAHKLMRTPKKNCPICLESTFRHRFQKFKCGHYACVYCIREYISKEIDHGSTEFSCPLGGDCGSIEERVVHTVTKLDCELRDKVESMYVKAGLAQFIDNFICPTTECGNAVFSDEHLEEDLFRKPASMLRLRTAFIADETGSDLRRFKCENCTFSYCVLCSQVWEQGMCASPAMLDLSCIAV